MRISISLFLILVFDRSNGHQEAEQFICDKPGRYENPTDDSCNSFYLCSFTLQGDLVQTQYSCPEGSIFSPNDTSCSKTHVCPKLSRSIRDVSEVEEYDNIYYHCKEEREMPFKCPRSGRYADLSGPTCRKYFLCSLLRNGTYMKTEFECPEGSLFDPKSQRCNTYYRCPCEDRKWTTEKHQPSTVTKGTTFHEKTHSQRHHETTHHNRRTTTTELPTTERCMARGSKKEFKCEKEGRFPNTEDVTCRNYYLCSRIRNQKYIKSNYSCPDGSTFDPKLRKCSTEYVCPCQIVTKTSTSSTIATDETTATNQRETTNTKVTRTTISDVSSTPIDCATSGESFICAKIGRYPDISDWSCSTYFLCQRDKIGNLNHKRYRCPRCLTFNPGLEKCTDDYVCPCSATEPPILTTNKIPPSERTTITSDLSTSPTGSISSSKSTVTTTTQSASSETPGSIGTSTSEKTTTTTEVSSSSSSEPSSTTENCTPPAPGKPFKCSKMGRFPDKRDLTCASYFLCSALKNGTLIKTQYKCPKGSKFDPAIQKCNLKYECPCSTISTPTTQSVPTSTTKFSTNTSSISTSKSTVTTTTQSTSSETPGSNESSTPEKTTTTTEVSNSSSSEPTSTTVNCTPPAPGKPFKCSEKGRFPDKRDLTCTSYFLCSTLKNGTLIKTQYKCPKGSKFDPAIQKCNLKYQCPCSTISTPTTQFVSTFTTKSPTPTTSTSNSRSTVTTTTQSTSSETPRSTETSTSEKPTITTEVSNSSSSKPITTTISPSTQSLPTSTAKSATPTSSISTSRRTVTTTTQATSSERPGSTGTNTSEKTTTTTTEVSSSSSSEPTSTTANCTPPAPGKPFKCSKKGRFPDKRDLTCTSYFLCSAFKNGTLIKTQYKCPKGSKFDPAIQKCHLKYECPCSTISTPTTQSVPTSTAKSSFPTSSISSSKSTVRTTTQSASSETPGSNETSTSEKTTTTTEVPNSSSSEPITTTIPPSTQSLPTSTGTSATPTSSISTSKSTVTTTTQSASSETPGSTETSTSEITKITTEVSNSSSSEPTSTTENCTPPAPGKPFKCSKKGRFPDKRDLTCTSYFLCSALKNGTLIKTQYKCPKGSKFDPAIQKCNLKYECPCTTTSTPTTRSVPTSTTKSPTPTSSTSNSRSTVTTTTRSTSSETPRSTETSTSGKPTITTEVSNSSSSKPITTTIPPSTQSLPTSTGKSATPTSSISTSKSTVTTTTQSASSETPGSTETSTSEITKITTEVSNSSSSEPTSTTENCTPPAPGKPFKCSKKGRFPDKRDLTCTSYFLCSALKNGTLIKTQYKCPKGSKFDPAIQKCNLKYECPCSTISTPTTQSVPTSTAKSSFPTSSISSSKSTVRTTTQSASYETPGSNETSTSEKTTTTTEVPNSSSSEPTSTTENCTPPAPGKPFKCSEKGRFPDKRDLTCTSYFLCSALKNGTLIKTQYKCPKSSKFDPAIQKCNLKYECPCSTISIPTTQSVSTSTTKSPTPTSSTSNSRSTVTTTTQSTSSETPRSTEKSTSEKPIITTEVSNSSSSKPITTTIPPSTESLPSSTAKSSTPTSSISTSKSTVTKTTQSASSEKPGSTETSTSGKTTTTTTESSSSSSSEPTSTTANCTPPAPGKPFKCSKKGRFPDKRDLTCTSYFLCSALKNGTLIKTQYKCPKGSKFDPAIQKCNLKYECPCTTTSTPTTRSVPTSTTKSPTPTSSTSNSRSTVTTTTRSTSSETPRSTETSTSGKPTITTEVSNSSSSKPITTTIPPSTQSLPTSTGKSATPTSSISTSKSTVTTTTQSASSETPGSTETSTSEITKITTEVSNSSSSEPTSTTENCTPPAPGKPFKCSKKGRFPDKRDLTCTSYFLCSALKNGTLIKTQYKCPKGSKFDPAIQKCNLKYECPCSTISTPTTQSVPTSTAKSSFPTSSISSSKSTVRTTTQSASSETPGSNETSTSEKTTTTTEVPNSSSSEPTSTTENCTPPAPGKPFKCSEKGRFPDKRDLTCTSYFLCSALKNGTLIKTQYKCPKSSKFDPAIQKCNLKYECPCSTISIPTTQSVSTSTTKSPTPTSSTSNSRSTVTTTTQSTSSETPRSTEKSTSEKPIITTEVSNSSSSKPITTTIPPSTESLPFSTAKSSTPTSSTSTSKSTVTKTTQSASSEKPGSTETSTSEKTTTTTTESSSSSSSEPTSTTENCTPPAPGKPFKCSKKGRYPDKRDLTCTSYFLCSALKNGTLIKTQYKCPKGSKFDPAIQKCNLKYECPCSTISTSTTQSVPTSTAKSSTPTSSISTSKSTVTTTTQSLSSVTPDSNETSTTEKTTTTTEVPNSSSSEPTSSTENCTPPVPGKPFKCSEKGRFPDKRDHTCTSYFLCSALKNGTLIKTQYKCPKGSKFDPTIQKCNLKYECPCSTISTPTTQSVSTSTTKSPTHTSSTSSSRSTVTTTTQSTSSETPRSTETSTSDKPTITTDVSNSSSSKPISTTIPPSTQSVPTSTAKSSTPSSSISTSKSTVTTTTQTTSSETPVSTETRTSEKTTTTTEVSSSSSSEPTSTTENCTPPAPGKPFKCSEKGRFPDKRDLTCTSYFLCSALKNGTLIKTQYKCPNGSKFDPAIQKCNLKYECPCSTISIPTTQSVSTSTTKSPTPTNSTSNSRSTVTTTTQSTSSETPRSTETSTSEKPTITTEVSNSTSSKPITTTIPPSTQSLPTSTAKSATPTSSISSSKSTVTTTTQSASSGTPGSTETSTSDKTTTTTEVSSSSSSESTSTTENCTPPAPGKPFKCSKKGRFSDKRDLTCTSYFLCSALKNGTLIKTKYNCPKGAKFDSAMQKCNLKYECPCSTTSTPITQSVPTSTTKSPTPTSSTSNSRSTVTTTTRSTSSETPRSTETSTSDKPTITTDVSNSSTSKPISTTIPPSTQSVPTSTAKSSIPTSSISTSKRTVTTTAQSISSETPGSTETSTSEKTTTTTEVSNSSSSEPTSTTENCTPPAPGKPFKCSKKGRFSDKRDLTCTSYFLCSALKNSTLIKTQYKCPKGSKFDPAIQKCNLKYECPCSTISTPTTQSVPTSATKSPTPTSSTSNSRSTVTTTTQSTSSETPRGTETSTSEKPNITTEVSNSSSSKPITTTIPPSTHSLPTSTAKSSTPTSSISTSKSTVTTTTQSTSSETPGSTETSTSEITKITTEVSNSSSSEPTSTTENCTPPAPGKPFKCSKKGRFPDKRDITCSSYFLCSALKSGTLIKTKYNCPKGSKFDPSLQKCNIKYECPCGTTLHPSTQSIPTSTNSPTLTNSLSTSEITVTYTTEPSSSKTQSSSQSSTSEKATATTEILSSSTLEPTRTTTNCTPSSTEKPFKCLMEGRFPDESDITCSSYFLCSALKNGTLKRTKYYCPKGSGFDPTIHKCNIKYECPCSTITLSTTEPSSTSSPTNISTSRSSKETSSTTESSSISSSVPTTTTENCIPPSPGKPFKCMLEGRFSDRSDPSCSSYFLCSALKNGTLLKTAYNCPKGSRFDPVLQKCSLHYVCPCIPLKSSTSEPSYSTTSSTGGSLTTETECVTPKPNFIFECKSQGRFTNIQDQSCTSYFLCSHLSDGSYVQARYRCIDGTWFDPRLQKCSSDYQCPCTTTTANTSITKRSTSESTTTPGSCQPSQNPFVCNSIGRFSNPGDLSCCTYYLCSATTNGTIIQVEYTCPEGTTFDPSLKICTRHYKCPCSVTESPKDFTTPSSECVIPTEEFICTSAGRFPDRQDVSCCNYFLCSTAKNGSFIKTEYSCPDETTFDPERRRCSRYYSCPCIRTEVPITGSTITKSSTTGLPSPTTVSTEITTQTQPPKCDISPNNTPHVCIKKGRFKNNRDISCTSYFLCSKLGNGTFIRTKYICPRFSYFDPSLGICNTQYKCPCQVSTTSENNGKTVTSSPLRTSSRPNSTDCTPPSSTEFTCIKEGKFLNTLDSLCASYIHCVKQGDIYQKVVVNCEGFTIFDVTLQTCTASAVCNICRK